MYKVFIENKPVIFTTHANNEDLSVLRTNDFRDVVKLISEIHLVPKQGIMIDCDDPEKLFGQTFQSYKRIEAAGGVVVNQNTILLIHRLGMWDLPKGKIEKGEIPEEAATREIEEECGIHGHYIVCSLENTLHTYEMKGDKVIKQTYWYAMTYEGTDQLIAQTEEDITEARWVELSEIDRFKSRMYPSLLPVLDECLDLIKNGTVFEIRSAE